MLALVVGLAGGLIAPSAQAAPRPPHGHVTDTRSKTSGCRYKHLPPKAVDTSEVPKPGAEKPEALPVPSTPAGGPRMAECGYVLPKGAGKLPKHLGFSSWMLFDQDSGRVLAAKDPHGRQRPASIVKTLLALVVLRDLDLNKEVVGTQGDANAKGTKVGIVRYGRYTVRQLLTGLLLASGNDLAHALARELGGQREAVGRMNAMAASLGCADTRAATPSGLDGPGMSTSAFDMATIFRAALRKPAFAKIVHTKRMRFPTKHGHGYQVLNDNRLLTKYPGDLGGKTGFTDDAQHTYLNAAERDGKRVGLVMLHGTNHLDGMYRNAPALMNYGFALARANLHPVGQLHARRQHANNPQARNSPAPTSQAATTAGSATAWTIVAFVLLAVLVVLLGLLWLRRKRDAA